MLRKLGGLQEGFVETVLLPQMHHAIGRLSIFHNHEPDENESHPELPNNSEAFELITKMKTHSNAQSLSTGKMVLREVKKATYALPPIADDLVALNRKFATFKKNIDSVLSQSETALVDMKSGIKILPLPSSSTLSSSNNNSRIPTPVTSIFQSISRSRSLSSNERDTTLDFKNDIKTNTETNTNNISSSTTSSNKASSVNTTSWVEGFQKLIPSFGSLSLNQSSKH